MEYKDTPYMHPIVCNVVFSVYTFNKNVWVRPVPWRITTTVSLRNILTESRNFITPKITP